MSEFKVGDLVRVKKCEVHEGCKNVGKTLEISNIRSDVSYFPYEMKDCNETFCAAELELVQRNFTKSDLKEGYICKHKDGRKSMFDGKVFNEIKNGKFTGNILITLCELTNDLRNADDYSEADDFDIIEIYKPHYDCIYKRPKNETKEVTLAEIEEKFGCKVKIIKEDN